MSISDNARLRSSAHLHPGMTQTSKSSKARILDGKRIAEDLLDNLKAQVDARLAAGKSAPGLAVVLVGNDPASAVYVRNKRRAAEKVGIRAIDHDLPADTSDAELLALIDRLNADPEVHGILVQLPLPDRRDATALIHRIDPRKDVDGFHPENVGHLALRQFGLGHGVTAQHVGEVGVGRGGQRQPACIVLAPGCHRRLGAQQRLACGGDLGRCVLVGIGAFSPHDRLLGRAQWAAASRRRTRAPERAPAQAPANESVRSLSSLGVPCRMGFSRGHFGQAGGALATVRRRQ